MSLLPVAQLDGSRPPENGRAAADEAPNKCGNANGKNSDDEAYMAASADNRELSSDGQSAAACDLTAGVAEPIDDVCSTDDELDSESRRPAHLRGEASGAALASRLKRASLFTF